MHAIAGSTKDPEGQALPLLRAREAEGPDRRGANGVEKRRETQEVRRFTSGAVSATLLDWPLSRAVR
jgi:hypothetical protein